MIGTIEKENGYYPVTVMTAVKVGDKTSTTLPEYLDQHYAPKTNSDVYADKQYVQDYIKEMTIDTKGAKKGDFLIADGEGSYLCITIPFAEKEVY